MSDQPGPGASESASAIGTTSHPSQQGGSANSRFKGLEPALVKVVQWLFFGLIVALAPIITNFFKMELHPQNTGTTFDVGNILSHGELFLISAAITADALGDFFFSESQGQRLLKGFLGGWNFIIFLFAILLFAEVANDSGPGGVNLDFITVTSIAIFIAAVLLGGSCKFLIKE